MQKGRPKIAAAEKEKKGTLRKHREAPSVLVALKIDRIPEPPDWLGAVGRKEWQDKADMLERMNMLHKTDLGLLALLSNEYENYIAAEADAAKVGRYYNVEDESGQIKYVGIHPAHTQAQQHLKSYITLCNEFGFSPASRSKISMPISEKIVSRAAGLLKKAV